MRRLVVASRAGPFGLLLTAVAPACGQQPPVSPSPAAYVAYEVIENWSVVRGNQGPFNACSLQEHVGDLAELRAMLAEMRSWADSEVLDRDGNPCGPLSGSLARVGFVSMEIGDSVATVQLRAGQGAYYHLEDYTLLFSPETAERLARDGPRSATLTPWGVSEVRLHTWVRTN